jgi:glycosyltransferase involved in cell wall biosynthesis
MAKISIIIPVYKQEKTIKSDIEGIRDALVALSIPFEIIPVIDGILDRSWKEAEKVKDARVKVVGYKTNHGKGYAVRYGFAKAKGDVIGFMDAGGDLSPTSLPYMIEQFLGNNADIVIGSKRHPLSKVHYPFIRRITSVVYQIIVKILFGISIRDSQVGMKLYKKEVLERVLPRLLVKEFAFDIEILAVANYLGYSKIIEAPIELNFEGVISSITWSKLFRTSMNMLWDTCAIYYRLYLRHYYDNANKRKWRFDPELNFRVNTG